MSEITEDEKAEYLKLADEIESLGDLEWAEGLRKAANDGVKFTVIVDLGDDG